MERKQMNAVVNVLIAVAAVVILMGAAGRAEADCPPPEELAKLIASDAEAGDWFGNSVAVSGDTAVVGAYNDSHAGGAAAGSAYVFVSVGGVWTQQAKLTASDAWAGDAFGYSIALSESGDTAVVGAPIHGGQAGSAYVFVKPPGGWVNMTETAKLLGSDTMAHDYFGVSVAVSGDTAVVGAHLHPHAGLDQVGSAYVFVRPPGGWANTTETVELLASGGTGYDVFGVSVALSGDTAVIGAFYGDAPGVADAGSAYVFTRSGAIWTQQAKLTASHAASDERFGCSVAISGDTAVVGANHDQTGLPGSAYVFVRPSGGWANMIETAELIASDAGGVANSFGYSVAVSGDTAVVGRPSDYPMGVLWAGSAYVFVRPPGGWANMTETAKLTASDAAESDQLGWSVALSGDTAVVGAFTDDHGGGPGGIDGQGSAYVFSLCAPTGACCAPDTGSCTVTTEAECTGFYRGDGIPCAANACKGACCLADGQCRFGTLKLCEISLGGTFRGYGTTCPATPLCGSEGDINSDGDINGRDVHCFIQCFLDSTPAPSCNCDGIDLNDDGVVDAADLTIFVCLLTDRWPACAP